MTPSQSLLKAIDTIWQSLGCGTLELCQKKNNRGSDFCEPGYLEVFIGFGNLKIAVKNILDNFEADHFYNTSRNAILAQNPQNLHGPIKINIPKIIFGH